MLLDAIIPPLKRHLAYGKFLQCLPFEWDFKKKRIFLNNSTSRRLCILTSIGLHSVYVVFQVFRIGRGGHHDLVDNFEAAVIMAIYVAGLLFRFELNPDFTPMETLNRLIRGDGIAY